MATEVRTLRWCDWHLAEKDQSVAAEPVTLTLAVGPGKATPLHVDLCDDCLAPFVAVLATATEYGSGKPSATVKAPAPAVPGSGDQANPPCPECGRELAHRSALRGHLRHVHDLTLIGAFPNWDWPNRVACPKCGDEFSDGRGLAAHTRLLHARTR